MQISMHNIFWEVLNGVGVDGVGGISLFFVFLFFLCFSHHSPRTRANNNRLLEKGEFHKKTDPVCTDPFRTSRIFLFIVDNSCIFGNFLFFVAGATGRELPNIFPCLEVPEYFPPAWYR